MSYKDTDPIGWTSDDELVGERMNAVARAFETLSDAQASLIAAINLRWDRPEDAELDEVTEPIFERLNDHCQ